MRLPAQAGDADIHSEKEHASSRSRVQLATGGTFPDQLGRSTATHATGAEDTAPGAASSPRGKETSVNDSWGAEPHSPEGR